jgi:hypothetical protein
MRTCILALAISAGWALLYAQVANPTPDQINAAISKGIQQAGQSQGLLLVDNASQVFQAFGEYSATHGKLSPGTRVAQSPCSWDSAPFGCGILVYAHLSQRNYSTPKAAESQRRRLCATC